MSQTQTVTHTWRPGANDTFDDDDEDNPLYITANHGPSDTETVVEVEDVGPDKSADTIAENLETLEIRANPIGESDYEGGVMNLE